MVLRLNLGGSRIQHQPGTAADSGIVAQRSQHEFGLLRGGERVPALDRLHLVQNDPPRSGDTAADDKYLRIAHAGDVGQRFSQIFCKEVYDGQGHFVPCFGAVENVLDGQWFKYPQLSGGIIRDQTALCLPQDAGGGGVLFQAAPLAAAAQVGLSVVHLDMADLAAGPVGARYQSAAHDDAAAHAGRTPHSHGLLRRPATFRPARQRWRRSPPLPGSPSAQTSPRPRRHPSRSG